MANKLGLKYGQGKIVIMVSKKVNIKAIGHESGHLH